MDRNYNKRHLRTCLECGNTLPEDEQTSEFKWCSMKCKDIFWDKYFGEDYDKGFMERNK